MKQDITSSPGPFVQTSSLVVTEERAGDIINIVVIIVITIVVVISCIAAVRMVAFMLLCLSECM